MGLHALRMGLHACTAAFPPPSNLPPPSSQGMEELVEKGLVRAIGISNFTITKTEHLLKTAKIPPAVNQVECHLYLQQQKLKEYCDSKGVVLVQRINIMILSLFRPHSSVTLLILDSTVVLDLLHTFIVQAHLEIQAS